MRPGAGARWVVLSWALAGCGLGNPELVVAGDVGDTKTADVGFTEDLGASDVGSLDVGGDVPGRDAGGDVVRSDVSDAGTVPDVLEDVGNADVGTPDVQMMDAGATDVGPRDSGTPDVGVMDTGAVDAGPRDTGPIDTGAVDTGVMDAGPRDVGTPDVGAPDVGTPDVGTPDVGTPDAGPTVVGAPTETCNVSGTAAINGFGRYVMTGTTAGRMNNHRSGCGDDDDDDVGYLVTLTAQSRLTWSARPTGSGDTFVPVVYLTPNCSDQGGGDRRFRDEVACIDNGGAPALTRGGTVDLPAGNYYLVVDGYQSGGTGPGSGAYEVTLTVESTETSSSYSQELIETLRCSATIPGSATSIADGDDRVSGIEGLGFQFNYFGRNFDRLSYSTNGYLTFIVDETSVWNVAAWRNHSIPFSGQPRGVLAPFWDDLWIEALPTSDVYFWLDGTAPSRVAHVYWRNVTFYRSRSTSVSFEARLFQGTNVIEFVYCNESINNGFSRGAEATVGLESYDGVAGRLVSLNRTGAIAPNTGYRFTPR